MDTARVRSKGQVTIPKRVRNKRSLRGLLSDYGKGPRVDGERIRTALRERAAAKYAVR